MRKPRDLKLVSTELSRFCSVSPIAEDHLLWNVSSAIIPTGLSMQFQLEALQEANA